MQPPTVSHDTEPGMDGTNPVSTSEPGNGTGNNGDALDERPLAHPEEGRVVNRDDTDQRLSQGLRPSFGQQPLGTTVPQSPTSLHPPATSLLVAALSAAPAKSTRPEKVSRHDEHPGLTPAQLTHDTPGASSSRRPPLPMHSLDDADGWDPHEEEPPSELFQDVVQSPDFAEAQLSPEPAVQGVDLTQQVPQTSTLPPSEAFARNSATSRLHLKRKTEEARLFSTAKLKAAKLETSALWQEHLNRQHLGQGSTPTLVDQPPATGAFARIHSSHHRVGLRHIVFCKRCGYWMAKSALSLSRPCPGKPPHRGGEGKLSRMLRGLHPEPKVTVWPDGSDTRVASPLTDLDGS